MRRTKLTNTEGLSFPLWLARLLIHSSEVIRRFPSLEILDGTNIPHILYNITPTTPIEPLVPQPSLTFPSPMKPGAVEESLKPFAFAFLQR